MVVQAPRTMTRVRQYMAHAGSCQGMAIDPFSRRVVYTTGVGKPSVKKQEDSESLRQYWKEDLAVPMNA